MSPSTPFTLPPPSSPHPLTTFHLFTSLPLELRQHIWHLALPGPRIHRIGWATHDRTTRSSCLSPALMLASHEARTEALHHLKRLNLPLNYSAGQVPPPKRCSPRCYFNPRLDTLFLTSPSQPAPELSSWLQAWLLQGASMDGSSDADDEATDFTLIRHLALDRSWLQPTPPPTIQLETLVRCMSHVQVLHIVSLNAYWSLQPWTKWREIGARDAAHRTEFSWVDMDEVRARPAGGQTRIWAEWGEESLMARGSKEDLSLEGREAKKRLGEVVGRLEGERGRWGGGWCVPEVRLGFVRCDRVEREVREVSRRKGLRGLGSGVWASNKVLKGWVGLG